MSDELKSQPEGENEESIIKSAPVKLRTWLLSIIAVITVITQLFDETNVLVDTAQKYWYKYFVTLNEQYIEYVLDASAEMRQPFSDEEIKWESMNTALAEVLVSRINTAYSIRTYGGECNTDQATQSLKKFDSEISDSEMKKKVKGVAPTGEPDLTRALDKAIDDLIAVRNVEKKFNELEIPIEAIEYKLKIMASGEICNKNKARLDEIKERVAKEGIEIDFTFVALAPNSETYEDFHSFAQSIAPEAKVIPASEQFIVSAALTDNEDEIFTKAVQFNDNGDIVKALGFFEYLGDSNTGAVLERAKIHLNEQNMELYPEYFDVAKAKELLRKIEDESDEAAEILKSLENIVVK